MVDYMTGTAGAVIAMIRAKGTEGHFGTLGPKVADALSECFALSVGWVVWVAAAFIALGVLGALRVERAVRAGEADRAEPTAAADSAPLALVD